MSKLCLGTFLKSIIKCKIKSKTVTQKSIVGDVMRIVDPEFDGTDDSMISNIVAGKKNPSNYVMDNINGLSETEYKDYIGGFKDIIQYIDSNRLDELKLLICYIIENDNLIKNETVVDLIGKNTKADIRSNEEYLEEFLAGVFIYVLKYTDNKDSNKYVKEIDELSMDKIVDFSATKDETKIKKRDKLEEILEEEDEDVLLEAQRFCVKYEDEIGLLPLCQIAYNVDPTHKNVRQMYTDYILSPTKVKRKILQLKEIPLLRFRDGWIDESVDKYDKQILEMGLATRSFLYDGAKYFHRAYWDYSDCRIVEFDPRIFEPLFKSNDFVGKCLEKYGSTISAYIGDYLWYKKNQPNKILVNPMDYLWKHQQLGSCPEAEMTYWVCLFIIRSAYTMIPEDYFPVDKLWENVNIQDKLIKTQEDMYYYALFRLYEVYELEREKSLVAKIKK